MFPVHSSSIHALVAALSLSASAFLAECRRAKAPADVCKALTHSVPHVCKSFVFSRAQVDTHATTTLCRIVCICRHLLMTKLQKNPTFSGLASRDTRTAHTPRLVEARQTALFFSCHFLVRQASFFDGARTQEPVKR